MEYVKGLLVVFECILIINLAVTQEVDPTINITNGFIKGLSECLENGRRYFAFKRIPYAKPPVGFLRFKPPQPPSDWPDTLDTRKDAPHCIQKNYLFINPKVEGEEDCLYLNVYTPKLAGPTAPKLPVMVFIHWGGFFAGYSSSDYLGPQFFLNEDVVLVTFNYRLGVMGFLSTNDDVAPGNYGLKDQVAALKWVQENIEYFSGDREKVTIFGQSSGGASVHYHMLSPSSKNLFHQAISQSGTALALWAKPVGDVQVLVAKFQAGFVGCNDTSSSEVFVECIRNVKAEELVQSGDKFKFFSVDPLTVYLPSIEKKTELNTEPFITKEPIEYIRNEEFSPVPWIIGVVNEEGLIRAEPLVRQDENRKVLNQNFDKLMPQMLALDLSTPPESIPNLWKTIKKNYFSGQNISIDVQNPSSIRSLINVYTDRSFAYSAYQAALFHNFKGHNPIWFYNFNYSGSYSYGDLFAATDNQVDYNWGVSHCDDLLYLFKTPALFRELVDRNDILVRDEMIKMWTKFAIYGYPRHNWTALDNMNRTSTSTIYKKINFLNIVGHYNSTNDNEKVRFKNEHGFYKNRLKFWEDIPLFENIRELDEKTPN